jgi:hypothetical protein
MRMMKKKKKKKEEDKNLKSIDIASVRFIILEQTVSGGVFVNHCVISLGGEKTFRSAGIRIKIIRKFNIGCLI